MAQNATVGRSTQNETVSDTVVSKVAEQTGTDPVSLDPLYSVVDPDALNALFETGEDSTDRPARRVTFTYSGCDVVVSAGGSVQVSRRE